MSPDDYRHGTANGYNTHNRHGEKACDACREARAATRKDIRGPRAEARAKPRLVIDYRIGGFSPDDALTGGDWTWDARRAIRVWVPTEDVA